MAVPHESARLPAFYQDWRANARVSPQTLAGSHSRIPALIPIIPIDYIGNCQLGFSTGDADLGRRSRLYEIAVPDLIPEPDNQNLLHSVKPENVTSYEPGF
jgi:hypothetical protein